MNTEICVVCGQPLGHKPLLGEYVMHPKCQESVLQYVDHYDEKNNHLVERIEELEQFIIKSNDLHDKLVVKALAREREMSEYLRSVLWTIHDCSMDLNEMRFRAVNAVRIYDNQNVTEDGEFSYIHECECECECSFTHYGEPDTDYCSYCEAGDCECAIHGPDGQKGGQCNTCSDLKDKLPVKALEREREMSNELYEALQNCIAWWGPDYDYAQKVMQKFEDHKKMFHDE